MSRASASVAKVVPGLLVAGAHFAASQAHAISIELKDAAPDRIERQRAFADGRLPLAATPDTKRLPQRLAEKGLTSGAAILIRIFKEESELEIWIEMDAAFVHFATYPVCYWSGTLGPKLKEGDKQSPEGFYALSARELRHVGRWPRSLNLGFPNAFDRANGRNGSYILVHGGCTSVGCFAMTDPVIDEVYALARAALKGEQTHVPVHVFPFRMTDAKLESHAGSPWLGFWQGLKAGYDLFEQTQLPPRVSVCEGRYQVEPGEKPAAPAEMPEPAAAKPAERPAQYGPIREACPARAPIPTQDANATPAGVQVTKLTSPVDGGGAMPAGSELAPH